MNSRYLLILESGIEVGQKKFHTRILIHFYINPLWAFFKCFLLQMLSKIINIEPTFIPDYREHYVYNKRQENKG